MSVASNATPTTDATATIRACARCGVRYDWRKSPSSSLKMTYCGSLCEAGDLGFTIDALLAHRPHIEARLTPHQGRPARTPAVPAV